MQLEVLPHQTPSLNAGKLITMKSSELSLITTIPRLITILTGCVLLLASAASIAQMPNAAQIEQFKNLPTAQQQALAKQYGIDLGSMAVSLPQPNLQQPVTAVNRQAINHPNNRAVEANANQASDNINLNESKDQKTTGQKLKQFGYELFNKTSDSFMPATDIPIPSEYIMGPGDNLIVQLYGKENASHALTVNREGQIQFPELGPVVVAGLSFAEVKQMIHTTVEQQMIGVKASITMGSLRSIRIFILGEARQPGSYTVNSLSTMTNALFASGGISKTGSLRNIQLKRGGKLITTLDFYDLLLQGDTSGDTRLLPGDVIFIPPIGKTVGVSGEVRRPAIYELKHETSSEQAIALAGGFLATAYPQVSRIERINQQGDRTLVDVDLNSHEGKQLAIQDADILQIFSILDTMEDVVMIEGHAERPGGLAWRKNLHFSDIIQGPHDLLPNPDLNAAIIVRELQPTRQIEVKLFSPGKAFADTHGESDPLLQPRDKIILFDYQTDRSNIVSGIVQRLNVQASSDQRRQVVSINGSVRFPGLYPLATQASADDLIILAGGLTDRAYSLSAEITRYVLDERQQQSIQHLSIDFNDNQATLLQAEDFIHIKPLPNWTGTETVTIEGEVAFPGRYTIRHGETLSQVIQRAGGLNPFAFAGGSVFSRAKLRELEAVRLRELRERLDSDLAAASLENQPQDTKIAQADAQQLLDSMADIRPTGRMVIDLNNILDKPELFDITLKDGDRLKIPMQPQAVTVIGEVQFATSHLYSANLSAEDYIDRSGGLTFKADKKRIYIIKANGSVYLPGDSRWFSLRGEQLEAGDTVVVPLDADRMKPLTLWASISQIIYHMALGAAAVGIF